MNELFQWKQPCRTKQDGVVIGSSLRLDWLLPWWWMHYSMHNKYPVTFCDFGDMSPQAKEWCQRRGELVEISTIDEFVTRREDADPDKAALWEKHLNLNVWEARLKWFKKPLACLSSPYERTVWIDLDCQVRKSITPIFPYCDNEMGVALAEEPAWALELFQKDGRLLSDEMDYNTGVIVFKHGCQIIQEWASACLDKNCNAQTRGDQEVLTRLLYNKHIKNISMPSLYNFRCSPKGIDLNATILHWPGNFKGLLAANMKAMQDSLFINFSLND